MTVSVPAGSYRRIPCALVLEDNPVADKDNRLDFETFPEAIEEVYALVSYREIGADRMPQPGGVAYRGGNWSTFSLQLEFRAGEGTGQRADRLPTEFNRTRLEAELEEMELKARWCQALGFPLERDLQGFGEQNRGIIRRAQAGGNEVLAAKIRDALSELRRNDPPKVLVCFGSWMIIRGYVTTTSLRWTPPFDPKTARPYGCIVNLQIQPLLVDYPNWQSIRAGAWSLQSNEVEESDLLPTAAAVREQEQAQKQTRLENLLGEISAGGG